MSRNAVGMRGGAGVIFNNYATPYHCWGQDPSSGDVCGYSTLLSMIDEGEDPQYYPHDVYIWDNLGTTQDILFLPVSRDEDTQKACTQASVYPRNSLHLLWVHVHNQVLPPQ